MKAFVAALVLLSVLIGGVLGGSCALSVSTKAMSEEAERLSAVTERAEKLAAFTAPRLGRPKLTLETPSDVRTPSTRSM